MLIRSYSIDFIIDSIKVISKESDLNEAGAETGTAFTVRFVIDEQGLDNAVGLEFVSLYQDEHGEDHIYNVYPFELVAKEGNRYTFECRIKPAKAGSFKTGVRMYPKSDLLPHRQDFCYVKWLY